MMFFKKNVYVRKMYKLEKITTVSVRKESLEILTIKGKQIIITDLLPE